jgi:hypothetical protein
VIYEEADTVRAGIDLYTENLLAVGIEREGGQLVVTAFDLDEQRGVTVRSVEEAAQLFAKAEERDTPV